MPTGYTRCIDEEDASFRTFALRVACAFFYDCGGLPDKFVPSAYHEQALTVAKAKLERARAWSTVEASNLATAAFCEASAMYEAGERKANELRRRYAAMRAKVEAWTPPGTDHQRLKDYMLEQLDTGGPSEHNAAEAERYRPKLRAGAEYRRDAIDIAEKEVTYHTEHWREDCQRAAKANKWTAALRASLPTSTDEGERVKP